MKKIVMPIEKYWLNKFAAVEAVFPPASSVDTKMVTEVLSPAGVKNLQRVANGNQATEYTVAIAIYRFLLFRYFPNISTLIACSNFDQSGYAAESSQLLFLNIGLEVGQTLRDAVRMSATEIEKSVEKLGYNYDRLRTYFDENGVQESDLFSFAFEHNTCSSEPSLLSGATCLLKHSREKQEITLLYNHVLVGDQFARSFLRHFVQVLNDLDKNVDQPLLAVEFMSQDEALYLLNINRHDAAYDKTATITRMFDLMVKKHPSRPAVSFGRNVLTYEQLDRASDTLANHLIKQYSVQYKDRVGIMMNRSEQTIVAIMAVLKAGATYVPLDPSYPDSRISFVAADAELKVLLVDNRDLVSGRAFEQLNIVSIADASEEGQAGVLFTSVDVLPVDTAYIIYTSGSTGNPKGVMVNHRNVVRLLHNDNFQFNITCEDVWTAFHSVCFDFSVWEIFGALLYGGRVVMVDLDTAKDPEMFLKLLEDEKVTVLNQTPSMFYTILPVATSLPKRLNLKYVIFGGEALNPRRLKKWKQDYPSTVLVNMYGITETTVHVTYKEIGEAEINDGLSNIGKPIPTMTIFIMDEAHRLMPVGTIGEIVVGGDGVAQGYLKRPELNTAKFIENPYASGERLYCSGDLGMLLENGEIVYKGRKDQQVKIRGYRIEPGEIEDKLVKLAGVKEALVICHNRNEGIAELIAYYTSDIAFDRASLKKYLQSQLPGYMIPAHFVHLTRLPLTINGKVDKRALPLPSENNINTMPEVSAPVNDFRDQLARLWAEELGGTAGFDDDFFLVGGDSIKAIRLVTKINQTLARKVSIPDLFRNPTINLLSSVVSATTPVPDATEAIARGMEMIAKFKESVLAKEENQKLLPARFDDIYPLTPIEAGSIYVYLMQSRNGSGLKPVYYDQFNYTLIIHDFPMLIKCIEALIQRHAIFRSAFYLNRFGVALKIILSEPRVLYQLENITALSEDKQLSRITDYLKEDLATHFDFDGDLPWRMRFFQLTGEKYFLVWSVHHAILDGWSIHTFITELTQCIEQVRQQGKISFPALKSDFKSYCAYTLGSGVSEDTRHFWRELLQGYSRSRIPMNFTGRPKRTVDAFMAMKQRFLSVTDSLCLQEAASRYNVPLKSFFFGAFTYLLKILCSEKDVVCGLVTHERPPVEDMDKVLGCFVHSVPVRIDFNKYKTKQALLNGVHEYMQNVKGYEIHLSEIGGLLNEPSAIDKNPIFDCLFNFTDFHISKDSVDNGVVQYAPQGEDNLLEDARGSKMTNTYFDLEVDKTGDRISVLIKYRTSFFFESDIERAHDLYQNILTDFTDYSKSELNVSNIISPEEKAQLLYTFNDTATPYRKEPIHFGFERHAQDHPDHIAIEQDEIQISYADLNQRANRLAHFLLSKGIGQNRSIGLICGRNPDMIIGMLGILKAGSSYVPIEPSYPLDRQKYIAENSDVAAILTDGRYEIASHLSCDFLVLPELDTSGFPGSSPQIQIAPTDLAYTIYTSGSTGRPKGVMIEHHSALNLIEWVNRRFAVSPSDRLLFITSMCFDLSVYDIFGMLSAGGTVVIAQQEQVPHVQQLKSLLVKHRITFWDSVPSTMSYLVKELEEEKSDFVSDHLRLAFMSGDWISVSLPERMRQYFPKCEVISLGGATEGTVWSNYHPILEVKKEWSSIPYGRPISNNFFYILDSDKQPVPKGMIGELYIGGVGVARGYAKNAEKNLHAFVEDPFNNKLGGRMYRTGDIGRMAENDEMEFLGRMDHQVKIRGFRVELGEIESCLVKHPAISEAVVTFHKDSNTEALCAYVITCQPMTTHEVKEYLTNFFPAYMLPAYILFMNALPLTTNGKIDRKALPVPEVSQQILAQLPGTPLEVRISLLWSDILEQHNIDVNANILELGAHSLRIGAFVNRANREFAIDLSIREVFLNPTISKLSGIIEGRLASKRTSIPVVQKSSHYPLSHAQKRLWILDQLRDAQKAYVMVAGYRIDGNLDVNILINVFTALVERHESLRTSIISVDSLPVQRINDRVNLRFDQRDLSKLQDPVTSAEVLINKESEIPYDLSDESLFRVRLLKISALDHILILSMHHIISDGWSVNVLIDEAIHLYKTFAGLAHERLPDLPIQYKDFASWQNKIVSSDDSSKTAGFWKAYLDSTPLLKMPVDFPRPDVPSFKGRQIEHWMDGLVLKTIEEIGIRNGVTPYMVLLTCVKALLYHYTGQSDIVIGTPVAGRTNTELERQVGLYLNTLPVRTVFEPDGTIEELLAKVKTSLLLAFEHEAYPFDCIVEKAAPPAVRGHSPIFDVMVQFNNLLNHTASTNSIPDLNITPFARSVDVSRFDLVFDFYAGDQAIQMVIEYNTELYSEETISLLALRLKNLLVGLSHSLTRPLNTYDFDASIDPQHTVTLLDDFELI